MKKIVALLVVILPLFAQDEARYSQIMKDVSGAATQVRKALDAGTSREDVAAGGEKLVTLFKDVEAFWTTRGAADAIEAAKKAGAAAKELANPAGVGPAKEAFGRLNEACKTCHAAHREKAEGGFKIR